MDPELPRSTVVLVLAVLATLNALAWVMGVRAVDVVVEGVHVSPTLLGTVAAVTGLALPAAVAAMGLARR